MAGKRKQNDLPTSTQSALVSLLDDRKTWHQVTIVIFLFAVPAGLFFVLLRLLPPILVHTFLTDVVTAQFIGMMTLFIAEIMLLAVAVRCLGGPRTWHGLLRYVRVLTCRPSDLVIVVATAVLWLPAQRYLWTPYVDQPITSWLVAHLEYFRLPEWHFFYTARSAPWFMRILPLVLVVNVVVEEAYFRGFVLQNMRAFGWIASLVNALLFSLYHTGQPIVLMGLLPQFVIACVLFLTRRTLWAPILWHFLMNTAGILKIA